MSEPENLFHHNGEPRLSSEENADEVLGDVILDGVNEKLKNLLYQREAVSASHESAEVKKKKLEEIGQEINTLLMGGTNKN